MELNRIYNECCLKTMARMPDEVVDLTITSPPYDDMRSYQETITAEFRKDCGYSFPFEDIAAELFRVTRQGGVVVWIVGDATANGNESGSSFRQALFFKEVGFNLFDTMIYLKPPRGAVGDNRTYWQSFEYMFVFSKGQPKTINLIRDRENKESRNGDNGTKRLHDGSLKKLQRGGYGEFGRRTNVWEYRIGKGHSSSDSFAFEHPAIFPERLAMDHIDSWSNENDLVFDPMMGSGTVAKAAILSGRNYLGSDIIDSYCGIAEKRIKCALDIKSQFTIDYGPTQSDSIAA